MGHLDWLTRLLFAGAIVASLVIVGYAGLYVLSPWDLQGPISLQLAAMNGSALRTLICISAVMFLAAVVASLIFNGRLVQFGTFAACIGLLYCVIRTGGMDYLMVRLQAGEEFEGSTGLSVMWGLMAIEMLAWVVPLAAMVAGSMLVEKRLDNAYRHKPTDKKQHRANGILAMLLTAVIAAILTGLLCQSTEKGQVIFAVVAAFYLAVLGTSQMVDNRNVIYYLPAVPIVGLVGFLYTAVNPARPAGLEALLHLPPNTMAAVLPIEYLAAGVASVIFAFWTSERMRFAKELEL